MVTRYKKWEVILMELIIVILLLLIGRLYYVNMLLLEKVGFWKGAYMAMRKHRSIV